MENHERTILVVEDDEDIAYVVAAMLEARNYTVKVAKNGLEALLFLEAEGMPCLILLDMKMPVMDGWKFAAEFHRRYDSEAPIVVMTAAASPGDRARQVQADDWIAKPFTLDEFLKKVQKHLPPDHSLPPYPIPFQNKPGDAQPWLGRPSSWL